MAYKIKISKNVYHKIRKMNGDLKKKVDKKIVKLAKDPYRAERLHHDRKEQRKYYVDRVYRILFKIDEKDKSIKIKAVGHRKKIY